MLLSDEEFGRQFTSALRDLASDDELRFEVVIKSGYSGLPRASGIFGCARQQLFSIIGEPVTDPGGGAADWAPTMGYAGEALARLVLKRMGYTLRNLELRNDLPFSGHIDDEISGLDLPAPMVWDSKLRGTYAARMLATIGIQFDPQMFGQMQAYMLALGIDRTMITVMPHDLTAYRKELQWNKVELAEPLVQRIFVSADEKAQELVMKRSEDLLMAKELGLMVHREANPGDRKPFPCPYCPWKSRCIGVDLEYSVKPGDLLEVAPLPDEYKEAA